MAIFMKVAGIEGSVRAEGYKKWIGLQSADLAAHRNITSGLGVSRNREASLPVLEYMYCTKPVDDASGPLTRWALGEPAKDQIEIHMTLTGSPPKPYLKYKLSEPILASYDVVVDDEQGLKGTERIGISFMRIEMEFIEYDESDKQSNSVVVAYDIGEAQLV